MLLIHAGPVEFLYYWLHRALHHRYLYSRYHSHHHSSIVTEPITSVIHPFAEHIAYYILFLIPMLVSRITETASAASMFHYILFIDFINNIGHCNFELMYTPTLDLPPWPRYPTQIPNGRGQRGGKRWQRRLAAAVREGSAIRGRGEEIGAGSSRRRRWQGRGGKGEEDLVKGEEMVASSGGCHRQQQGRRKRRWGRRRERRRGWRQQGVEAEKRSVGGDS
ncbi:hypothetical protein Tsubulata_015985 [Turnera subulata]|uniref:Fatty acid hydroxylase domain-containing protein n=1 Tax=Turnera subulata TaxID=218843 RepID=A0A9Q0FK10_9ROSI|nr:hypothetical protein Tsubulata_015985 [Turnera subulata]